MKKVTIVPSDRVCIIDGVVRRFDFTVDPNIHAVQWDGEKARVEQHKGGMRVLVGQDDFMTEFGAVIDGHIKWTPPPRPDRPAPPPSDRQILLHALAKKAGITEKELENAKKDLLEKQSGETP